MRTVDTPGTGPADLRDLWRQVRVWRRGRADTRLVDAVGDAYTAVLATVMLTSMAVSVVVNVRTVATEECAAGPCTDARAALPWIVGLGLVAGCLALARLFGPMLVSPAVATWLLPTPVDRTALLRPRLVATATLALLVPGVVAAATATLAGFPVGSVAAYALLVGAGSVAAVALATLSQAHRRRWARVATWVLAAAVWLGLLALTLDLVRSGATAPGTGIPWLPAALALIGVAGVGTVAAYAGLRRVSRDLLTPGGALVPGLSGALASLDFALVYDILVARYWLARSTVRVVRGRGLGAVALVFRELVRLRRSPQLLLVLAASLVVPYLSATVGLGRAVLLVAALTGFLAGTSLFSSLRVLSRTPSLVRVLPLTAPAVRSAVLAVPAAVVLLWALAGVPALREALGVPWSDEVALALAVGAAAVTASVRWVTGKPPDYRLPLVTSPMGAVPTSLYVSAVRGFDALLLGVAPLLVAPTAVGAAVAVGLDAVVLAVLLNRA